MERTKQNINGKINCSVLVIGAGFSGICMGVRLRESGITDFLILDKAAGLGGTWRENTYPGAECDVPSALYSYSFEHNSKWQFKWSEQSQILQYQDNVAKKYHLTKHMRFKQAMKSAVFDQQRSRWLVETTDGQLYEVQHLVTAVGQLHLPHIPGLPGESEYQGVRFHSAQWDHSVKLEGSSVAVIGNAASALQFIPEIAPHVSHLSVYQRSANWVVPKQDRPYKPWEQRLSEKLPFLTRLYRLRLWLKGEFLLLPALRRNRMAQGALRWMSRRSLKRHIRDPDLIDALTPDYPVGAKRILFSDNYYAALARDNVRLVVEPIECFTRHGIRRQDGREETCDVVIYATGFQTNPFLQSMDIRGRNNRSIHDAWSAGAHAYLGVSTHGFPNLHMMYGPNTNLGHNSMIIMIEAQASYIADCVSGLRQKAMESMEVLREVEVDYNLRLQSRLQRMTWQEVPNSWYMDRGLITNNWPGSTWEYMRRMRKVPWRDYRLSQTSTALIAGS